MATFLEITDTAVHASIWKPGCCVETILFLDNFTGSAGNVESHVPDYAPSGFAWVSEQVTDQVLDGTGKLINPAPANLATQSDVDWEAIVLPDAWRLELDAGIIGFAGEGNIVRVTFYTSLAESVGFSITLRRLDFTVSINGNETDLEYEDQGVAQEIVIEVIPTGFIVYVNGEELGGAEEDMTIFPQFESIKVQLIDTDAYTDAYIDRLLLTTSCTQDLVIPAAPPPLT